MGQIDNLYRRFVHTKVARSDLIGQFEENFGFKRKRDLIVTVHFVKQIISDLDTYLKEGKS